MKYFKKFVRFESGTDVPQRIARLILIWGILSQYVLYYLGIGPLVPILIVWPAISLGIYCAFKNGCGKLYELPAIWFVFMVFLLVQGLLQFSMNGTGGTYVARWFFGFGIAAFLPFLGMYINPDVIYRCASYLGVQTLLYCCVVILAVSIDWNFLRQSNLGNTGIIPSSFLNITLFSQEISTTGERRAVAFAPYATYAGAVGCFYLILCLGERSSVRMFLGVLGWISLVIMTRSRAAIICMFIVIVFYYSLLIPKRYLALASGLVMLTVAIGFQHVIVWGENFIDYVQLQRGTSSEVRHNLRTIAFDEWRFGLNPVLGSGGSIPGGSIVANMPIGTHDSYYSNLFMRGAIGAGFIFLPVLVTFVYGLCNGVSPQSRIASTGMLLFLIYSYSESLESLYMYVWPIFLIIGSIGLCAKNRSV